MSSRYGNFLTMLLVFLIVAIIGLAGFFVYTKVNSNAVNNNAQSAIDEFNESRKIVSKKHNDEEEEGEEGSGNSGKDLASELQSNLKPSERNTKREAAKTYMEGYEVKGIIEIPKTKVKYPVLSTVTKRTLEIAVGIAYGPGLNEVGNTVIYGHNLRNGLFFSDNKKLTKDDKIYITDQYGDRVTYVIYNKYETTPNDASYMPRDTEGRREISLQTCTDDSSGRIIIWAMEELTRQEREELEEKNRAASEAEANNEESQENQENQENQEIQIVE
ncbi:MAG: sortase [Clostridia bacterium]|nr:sortase [Clostridia bacterium]